MSGGEVQCNHVRVLSCNFTETDGKRIKKKGRKRSHQEVLAPSKDEKFGKECKIPKTKKMPAMQECFAEPQAPYLPPIGGWQNVSLQKLLQIGFIHSSDVDKSEEVGKKIRSMTGSSFVERNVLRQKREKLCLKFTKAMHDYKASTELQTISKLIEESIELTRNCHENTFPRFYAVVKLEEDQ